VIAIDSNRADVGRCFHHWAVEAFPGDEAALAFGAQVGIYVTRCMKSAESGSNLRRFIAMAACVIASALLLGEAGASPRIGPHCGVSRYVIPLAVRDVFRNYLIEAAS
jgi:hypothetical protein